MKPSSRHHLQRARMVRQRGVVLFFALISLLAMSLAAVALIRSVDTSTLIAGNLAFKQAATTSGDAGTEAAITLLTGIQTANTGTSAFNIAAHPFNITDLNATPGYHSSLDPGLDLFDDATWNETNNVLLGEDGSGNTVRYIIQRMCRIPNQPIQSADCLFGIDPTNPNPMSVPLPHDICEGAGCPPAGRSPQFRITTRTTGPRNSISYVQAFVN